jgi:hypothetical protein
MTLTTRQAKRLRKKANRASGQKVSTYKARKLQKVEERKRQSL